MSLLHVWIGFDPREPLSYQVCKNSIIETSPGVVVHKLDAHTLRQRGLFSREWRTTPEGQTVDVRDNAPFSTQFSYSRFLVPHLARELGVANAVFLDADMVCLHDMREVLLEAPAAAGVSVVKHNFEDANKTKMDGMQQTRYNRKLWSAFMLFNLDNPYTRDLTPDVVNTESGSYLHQLRWMPDHLIGELDPAWQFVPEHNDPATTALKVVHFTRGTPEMYNYRNTKFAEIWHQALVRSMQ